MPCGCIKHYAGRPAKEVSAPPPQTFSPYRTAPVEVCLLCADKHVSSVLAEIGSGGRRAWFILGELELARRHLVGLHDELSAQAAETLYAVAAASPGWLDALHGLSRAVNSRLELVQKGGQPPAGHASELPGPGDVSNRLLGVLRLGAACRLASELGYMDINRSVIVGDLVAAAEHLVRHDAELAALVRELRHQAQTALRAVLSAQWTGLCDRAAGLLPAWGSAEHAADLSGLRAYLGLPPL